MPFQLNEAPNLALRHLNQHWHERNCCQCWSILCCLPTLGISLGWCDNPNEDREYDGCGHPRDLTAQEKASLQALQDSLKSLLIKKSKVPKESKDELKNAIKDQVSNTIHILEAAVNQNNLKHGYLLAVQISLNLIKTRFDSEILFMNSIKSSITITGYNG